MSRGKRALALALTLFVVLSVAAPIAAQQTAPVTVDGPKTPGTASTPVPNPAKYESVPSQRVRSASAAVDRRAPPSTQLADRGGSARQLPRKRQQLPAAAETGVIASRHARSIDVEYAYTTDGLFATVLTDDENHASREVGIPTSVLDAAVGKRPPAVFGVHEDGTEWSSPVRYASVDGTEYALIDVPRFSTNTVTWSGQFVSEGDYTDDSSFQYEQGSASPTDFTINVTGVKTTEQDLESAQKSNGESMSLEIAGNQPAVGPDGTGDPEVTFVGVNLTTDRTQSGTGVDEDGSAAISVGGNVQPLGPDGTGDPNLTLTGNVVTIGSWKNSDQNSGGGGISGTSETDSISTLNTVKTVAIFMDIGGAYDVFTGDCTTDIGGSTYTIADGNIDQGWSNKTFSTAKADGDGSISVTCSSGGREIDIETLMAHSPPPQDAQATIDGNTVSYGNFTDGESKIKPIDFSEAATAIDFSATGGTFNWTLEFDQINATEDPAVDIDGDASDDVTYTGILVSGETSSATSSSLITTATTSIDVSTVNTSDVEVQVNYTEVERTEDASIEVNGNWANQTGELAVGSTTTLTTNSDWIITGGTNRVNVTVGNGTTADTPTPTVELYYTHDGDDKSIVEFDGEKWSETYNISKTYAQDSAGANVTIPFDDGSVAQIRTLEKQVNSGGWSAVDASNYTLDGTTLTIDLGAVSSGDKVEVRTTGSKVNPSSCTITVLEPTVLGATLDSNIQLDTHGPDCNIGVGGTQDGSEIHYATGETWSTPDDFARFEAGGTQELHLPNAGPSQTFRVKTLPVSVSPEVGDVDVRVDSVSDTEPSFAVSEGPSPDDPVDYTFENAVSGEDYILYSTTKDTVRASGTASSPLMLGDDDSAETLQFQVDDGNLGGGGGGSIGGGGAGGSGGTTIVERDVSGFPLWALAAALALLGLAYVASRRPSEPSGLRGRALARLGDFGRFVFTTRWTQLGMLGLALVALVQAGALPQTYVQVLGFLVVPAAVYWLLRRAGRLDRQGYGVLAGVAVVAVVLAVETLTPGAISEPVGENLGALIRTTGPIIVIFGAYFLYRFTRGDEPTYVIEASTREDDNS